MSYADFTLSSVVKQFSVTTDEATDLYSGVVDAPLTADFSARLSEDTRLGLAISTEKARSEFIIAPLLAEVRRMAGRSFGLFSGVDFPVSPAQGLTGVCDYIITRSPEQFFIQAPVLMVVEAKKEDMIRGYGQCAAEMLAAQAFNLREGVETPILHGAVTLGNVWQFLQLDGATLRIDSVEYHIERAARIAGILLHIMASVVGPTSHNIVGD